MRAERFATFTLRFATFTLWDGELLISNAPTIREHFAAQMRAERGEDYSPYILERIKFQDHNDLQQYCSDNSITIV